MNSERLLKTFTDIVQIDSPTGFEAEMSSEIATRLRKLGLESTTIDKTGNVIAHVDGDFNKEVLIFNAHLDTVEPGRGIKPIITSDGVIKSSGDTILGADNKVGVAVILEAVESLREEGFLSNHPLDLVFTVSEESGNVGAVNLDYQRIRSKKGHSFDASSVPLGTIVTASPFYNRFDIDIKGKSAHASKPEEADNVLEIFGIALGNLRLGRVSEDTLVTIGRVRAGDVRNAVPGSMIINGEVRSFIENELELETENVRRAFAIAIKARATSQIKMDFERVRENSGFKFDPNNPFIQEIMQKLKKMNIPPSLIKSMGCYDANIFAEHGLMVVNHGGGSARAHTVDEQIHIKDLEKLGAITIELTK